MTQTNVNFNCMNNPISYIQNTRVTFNRFLDKNVREVLVQFKEETPAWIPYETLLAIGEIEND